MLNWLQDKNSHPIITSEAKKLSWCQLSEIIMSLEHKLHHYSETLGLALYVQFHDALELLENEKSIRVNDSYDYKRHLQLTGTNQMMSSDDGDSF